MIEEYYKLYIKSNIRLAQLITIKHSENATIMNEYVALNHGSSSVDMLDPTTWRYYLHLSGQYHFTDTVMEIFSLDTSEKIIFNKENLSLHTETALKYKSLSDHYYDLVELYPEQETLIKGILFPVDIDYAIAASDGDILTYPSELVEVQELTLMSDLQDWIHNYLARWHIKAFVTSDNLYPSTYQANLYINIVNKLLNLRLARCKTPEVHSFHLRAYFASHGKLDKYISYMTVEQKLWLYRNIMYIENHTGIKNIFNHLIENILTKRKIPLAEFTIRQYEGFDEDYYPNYRVRKNTINDSYNIDTVKNLTFTELSEKELNTSPDNFIYWQNNKDRIIKIFQNSGNGVMMTKDLESIMYDNSNSVPHTFESIMLNEWAYHSLTNNYKSIINFKNPIKSIVHTCSTDIAYLYMTYLVLKLAGINIDKLPIVVISSVLKRTIPTITEMIAGSGMSYNDNVYIAEQVKKDIPIVNRIYSIRSFSQYARSLYKARLEHWICTSNIHQLNERAYASGIINTLFLDTVIDTNTDNKDIREWLVDNNLPTDEFSDKDTSELIWSLFDKSTGYSLDKSLNIADIQRAMISIMKQLTSYSLQYITELASSDIKIINWAAIRPGNMKKDEYATHYVKTIKGHIQPVSEHQYFNSQSTPLEIDPYPFLEPDFNYNIDPTRRLSRGVSLIKAHSQTDILDYEAHKTTNEYVSMTMKDNDMLLLNDDLNIDLFVTFKSLHLEISSGGQPMHNWMTQNLTNEEIQQLII